MKTFQLEGKSREIASRSADQKRALKAMRKEKEIPAVLYGGEQLVHFTVTQSAVRTLIYTPNIYAVELTIDGVKHMAIMKEIQFQPVTDEIRSGIDYRWCEAHGYHEGNSIPACNGRDYSYRLLGSK